MRRTRWRPSADAWIDAGARHSTTRAWGGEDRPKGLRSARSAPMGSNDAFEFNSDMCMLPSGFAFSTLTGAHTHTTQKGESSRE